MSSVSVLQATGLGAVTAAKPTVTADTATPSTPSAQGASTAASVLAPTYPSPRLQVDPLSKQVIVEYRDATSGEATQQVPSKAQLRLYELNQQQGEASAPAAPTPGAVA